METYTLINTTDFIDSKLNKDGTWIIYQGHESQVTVILTELSQMVIGINYGIYKEGKNGHIELYKNGKLIETYNSEISKNNILHWSLSNI